jgi:hypothetical protein
LRPITPHPIKGLGGALHRRPWRWHNYPPMRIWSTRPP